MNLRRRESILSSNLNHISQKPLHHCYTKTSQSILLSTLLFDLSRKFFNQSVSHPPPHHVLQVKLSHKPLRKSSETYLKPSNQSDQILAQKRVRLAPNGTNPGLFQIRFQYILAPQMGQIRDIFRSVFKTFFLELKCTEKSWIFPIWGHPDPFWGQNPTSVLPFL